jgi:DNA-binding CsgD family transcriptional regulator
LLDASLAMRRALGDRRGIGLAQRGLAHLGVAQSDWARARASYEHCLAHFRTMGDLAGVNTVQQDLADLALDCGTHHEAEDLLHDSLCVDARLGDDWSIARHGLQSGFFVWVVGLARARLPDPPRDGAGFFKEVLRVQQRWQGEHGLATCFRELARAALERSDDLHAEQLSGAADALDAQASAAVDVGPDVSTTTRRRTHGPAGAWQQGRVMPPERTLAVALVNSPELWSVAPSEPRQRLAQLPGALTSREVEVLRLVATGLTNHEIASRLVVSERTVATHMDHIFAKIQVSSRAAATAFAIRSGIA